MKENIEHLIVGIRSKATTVVVHYFDSWVIEYWHWVSMAFTTLVL